MFNFSFKLLLEKDAEITTSVDYSEEEEIHRAKAHVEELENMQKSIKREDNDYGVNRYLPSQKFLSTRLVTCRRL